MKRFEYDVSVHPSGQFQQLAYLCTDSGECSLEQIPTDQLKALTDILDDHGTEGWELVQLFFVKEGVVACWKRAR